jgi:hypothetical protein
LKVPIKNRKIIEIQIEDSQLYPFLETKDSGSKVSTNFSLENVSPHPLESMGSIIAIK